MGAFISHMKGLMGQLASVQSAVIVEDAIAILLKAVKHVFPALVTTWRNIPNPTFEGVIQSVLDEDKQTSSSTTPSTSHLPGEQALVAQAVVHCSHCRKKGHTINNCWVKYPNKMKCKKCNKKGHITSKCPQEPPKEEANFASSNPEK